MTTTLSTDREIRTSPRPQCAICGGPGVALHHNLTDRLFGADGSWALKHCPGAECGLVWLDPMPLPEDIGKAYANYYTHTGQDMGSGTGLVKRTYLRMKRGYLAAKYGYEGNPSEPAPAKNLGKLLYLFPLRRSAADASVRFLPSVPRGRLLDVGCGSGEWLTVMRDLGWQVEGLDFDENAVRVARQTGLDVRVGALEQQHYPDESFDAVTLNHVIEHVPDPVATMKECARILKKGGKLVLATPNNASLSHRFFKNDWRGLEPPRHLHIFSFDAMRRALRLAGFKDISVRPIIAASVIYESSLLRSGCTGPAATALGNRSAKLKARLFNLAELCVVKFNPAVADCLTGIAIKS